MFTLLTCAPQESLCASILRKARWGKKDDGQALCPRCHCGRVKKDGHYRSYQLYYCHDCKRNFNDKTGTLFHYSRKPLSIWFLAIYLFFVLWIGCSVREISVELIIPYERCYRFIRTLMERIAESNRSILLLKGKVESDEFYIKSGLKGRHYHEEIIQLGREPRKRALKPWKGRGTFEKDQPMIVCLHQRKGPVTCFHVPQRKRQPLLGTLRKSIKAGAMVYTDDFRPYRFLPRYGYRHRFVNHSEREYARGDAHVNNCECASNLYQIWMSKFMGVNKHNLETYSKTFQFIHQSRMNELPREERFMRVLSLQTGGRNISTNKREQIMNDRERVIELLDLSNRRADSTNE